MDIAQLSSALAIQNTSTAVGTAVLGMSLDTIEQAGDGLTKMMEMSVNPSLGGNIDFSV
jgi:hypothetical protein